MEKNESPRDEEVGFLPPWEKLRGFARGWAFRLLGINPEAEEVGEDAYHELLVSWVKGRFPAHPFGWLKRVVVRMASKNGHVFHSKMFRAGGEESFLENIPAPDPKEQVRFEEDRGEWEAEYLEKVFLPALTPDQRMDLQALKREGSVKKAARARGKAPANFRRSLKAIEKKAKNFLKMYPPPT